MSNLRIPSSDRCPHCGHWSGDAEQPFRIYSEARAKWLEKAAQNWYESQGDDDWLDWEDEHKQLLKAEVCDCGCGRKDGVAKRRKP